MEHRLAEADDDGGQQDQDDGFDGFHVRSSSVLVR
jgi:hypothetical protein